MEEYNGVWPRDPFTRSSKITQAVSSCFTRPFKFEYSSGRVGSIYAPEDCPDLCVNIVRGILNMLQITIKKSQNVYELQEVCVSHFISKTTLLEECVLGALHSCFSLSESPFKHTYWKTVVFRSHRKYMWTCWRNYFYWNSLKTFFKLLCLKCNAFIKKEPLAMNMFVI